MQNTALEPIHVAVGIIRNSQGEILIAFRDKNKHEGGLWEFPGGKVEAEESVIEALKRELLEELGLEVIRSSPLLEIQHNYSGKYVRLDVWEVEEFQGEARGMEGQPVSWVGLEQLPNYEFPEANLKIISFLLES